jgi:hypothetical protein
LSKYFFQRKILLLNKKSSFLYHFYPESQKIMYQKVINYLNKLHQEAMAQLLAEIFSLDYLLSDKKNGFIIKTIKSLIIHIQFKIIILLI